MTKKSDDVKLLMATITGFVTSANASHGVDPRSVYSPRFLSSIRAEGEHKKIAVPERVRPVKTETEKSEKRERKKKFRKKKSDRHRKGRH